MHMHAGKSSAARPDVYCATHIPIRERNHESGVRTPQSYEEDELCTLRKCLASDLSGTCVERLVRICLYKQCAGVYV
jgi:hypothetical protein